MNFNVKELSTKELIEGINSIGWIMRSGQKLGTLRAILAEQRELLEEELRIREGR